MLIRCGVLPYCSSIFKLAYLFLQKNVKHNNVYNIREIDFFYYVDNEFFWKQVILLGRDVIIALNARRLNNGHFVFPCHHSTMTTTLTFCVFTGTLYMKSNVVPNLPY